jgi:hypothetical protein
MSSINRYFDVIEFLSNLEDSDINNDINDLIRTNIVSDRMEILDDILLRVRKIVNDDDYNMIVLELKKIF